MHRTVVGSALVALVLIGSAGGTALWLSADRSVTVSERLPGQTRRLPGRSGAETASPANPGTLTAGPGRPSALAGSWPGFRGPRRDNVAHEAQGLSRSWPAEGPHVLWRIPLGEGYAGAAVHRGRVYLIDYDQQKKEDAIRCLSLDDGREIWRYSYSVRVKRNHGMSRTVPAVNDRFVVSIGPKCHVTCLEADTGKLVWKFDLVREFGTTVPPWYAGQCALIDGDAAIIAPGGDPLMMAVDLATGKVLWRTPNPGGFGMTHSSVMPFDPGRDDGGAPVPAGTPPPPGRQYIYCTTRGIVGIAAENGRLLWTYANWRISIANIPSPVQVDGERFFVTGGYDAGSAMLRLRREGGRWRVEEVFRLKPSHFSSAQHTPILYRGHLYGVLPGGQLACIDLEGRRRWASGPENRFGRGLGPYLLADGMLYVLDDRRGVLRLVSADPGGYNELAAAKVLAGREAWAPMALAAGRLLLRDANELVCIEVGGGK